MHLKRRTRRDDERGAVAILVAASLVMLCMGCAMAVDIGNVAQLHRHAQLTVDDAAISGADLLVQGTDSLTQIVSATEGYINENWGGVSSSAWNTCPDVPSGYSAPSGSGENCVTFNGSSTAASSSISVELPPQSVPFTVARLGGFTSGTVKASASAVLAPGTAPCALCLLGPGGLTLSLNGSGSFTVTDSVGSGDPGVVVDSAAVPDSQIKGGAGSITAPSIGVVSSASGSGYSCTNSSPCPMTGIQPIPDPLGYLVPPTPTNSGAIPTATCPTTGTAPLGSCGVVSLTGGGNLTIFPGNYSSINVGANSTLTLMAGNYFITGPFTVGGTGGATVQQSAGVLLYFTCSSGNTIVACTSPGQAGGSLNLSGTGTLDIGPQTTGPYAGLTVFADRNDDSTMTLSGTPAGSFSGTIYAKDSALALNGTGSALESMIVVGSASISGHAAVAVNYNASQNVTLPSSPYLCSTAANNC